MDNLEFLPPLQTSHFQIITNYVVVVTIMTFVDNCAFFICLNWNYDIDFLAAHIAFEFHLGYIELQLLIETVRLLVKHEKTIVILETDY